MQGVCACRAGHRDRAKKVLDQAAAHSKYKQQALGLIRQMEAEHGKT
jgi:Tfp pilus assembly protein PilF